MTSSLSATAIATAEPQLLTHSRTQCFKACARRHFYRYELGLRRAEESKPLRMGTAVHLGLDWLAQGLTIEQVLAELHAQYTGQIAAEYSSFEGPDGAERLTAREVEMQTVLRLVAGYAWRWSDYRFEVLATEQAFSLRIANPETGRFTPTFQNAGKIDKIVRLHDGRIAVMEHKTTSMDINPNADYWRKLRMDAQVSRYLMASRELGYTTECVVYDVIRKPGISPRKVAKTDQKAIAASGEYFGEPCATPDVERETPAMFGARLANDIVTRPDFYFQRQEIVRTDADIAEFRQELWDDQKALRECQLSNRWPRNTASCLAPFRCEFFDLCASNWKPETNVAGEQFSAPDGFALGDLHPELAGAGAAPEAE